MNTLYSVVALETGALLGEHVAPPVVDTETAEVLVFTNPPYPRAWDAVARTYSQAPFTTVLHAAYDDATGRLLSESSMPIDPLFVRTGVGLASFEAAQIPVRHQWDAVTRTYVSRPLLTRTRLTLQEFWRRFTRAERVAIKQYRNATGTSETVKANLDMIEADLRQSDFVDLTDPEVIEHVTYLVNGLAQAGVIATGDRQARGAAILAPAEAL